MPDPFLAAEVAEARRGPDDPGGEEGAVVLAAPGLLGIALVMAPASAFQLTVTGLRSAFWSRSAKDAVQTIVSSRGGFEMVSAPSVLRRHVT